jgi:hypothetical protein
MPPERRRTPPPLLQLFPFVMLIGLGINSIKNMNRIAELPTNTPAVTASIRQSQRAWTAAIALSAVSMGFVLVQWARTRRSKA